MLPECVQHVREFTSQRHDRNLGAPAIRDLLRPSHHGVRLPPDVERPRRLTQSPAHLRRAGSREARPLGTKPSRVLARHKSQIRRDTRGGREAADIVIAATNRAAVTGPTPGPSSDASSARRRVPTSEARYLPRQSAGSPSPRRRGRAPDGRGALQHRRATLREPASAGFPVSLKDPTESGPHVAPNASNELCTHLDQGFAGDAGRLHFLTDRCGDVDRRPVHPARGLTQHSRVTDVVLSPRCPTPRARTSITGTTRTSCPARSRASRLERLRCRSRRMIRAAGRPSRKRDESLHPQAPLADNRSFGR